MKKLFINLFVAAAFLAVSGISVLAQNTPGKIVEMTNHALYNPAELVISAGETVTWYNKSDQVQTITVKTRQQNQKEMAMAPADAEPFSSGAIEPGESFTYTFYEPGTYELVSLTNPEKDKGAKVIVKD